MDNASTRRGPAVVIVVLVSLAIALAAIWFVFGKESPPKADSVVGHSLPSTAKVLGTHQWYNGLGGDSLSWAVIEIGSHEFGQLCKDAGYSPFIGDAHHFFQSKKDQPSLEWWNLANLPDSPVVSVEKESQDGASQHYIKYEGGKMYVVRSFYAKR